MIHVINGYLMRKIVVYIFIQNKDYFSLFLMNSYKREKKQ